MDDCAVTQDIKKRTSEFINLAFSGRHHGISVWVLTQQLTSIAKPFRDNIACIISFHHTSEKSMKMLFDDFGGNLDVEARKNFCDLLKNEEFAKMCFCLKYPYTCYLEIPSASEKHKIKTLR